MKKFQVTIQFEWSDAFGKLIPQHRNYINKLINRGVIDQYVVSMETQTVWITVNAHDKDEVEEILEKSPLYPHWDFTVNELFVFDGQLYRLPALQLN